MDSISFNTHLLTAASRNGWEVCERDTDGDGYRLSSTAHEGLLHVLPEGEKFCIIPAMAEVQVVTREELGKTLRELVKTDTSPKGTPPLRTEREQMILARTAQHRYRNGLEALWGGRCACTGIGVPELLRASHAKPWKDCTDAYLPETGRGREAKTWTLAGPAYPRAFPSAPSVFTLAPRTRVSGD